MAPADPSATCPDLRATGRPAPSVRPCTRRSCRRRSRRRRLRRPRCEMPMRGASATGTLAPATASRAALPSTQLSPRKRAGHLWTMGYHARPGRHSSAVEQLFRKQQVLGSNPSVGSTPPIRARIRRIAVAAASEPQRIPAPFRRPDPSEDLTVFGSSATSVPRSVTDEWRLRPKADPVAGHRYPLLKLGPALGERTQSGRLVNAIIDLSTAWAGRGFVEPRRPGWIRA